MQKQRALPLIWTKELMSMPWRCPEPVRPESSKHSSNAAKDTHAHMQGGREEVF